MSIGFGFFSIFEMSWRHIEIPYSAMNLTASSSSQIGKKASSKELADYFPAHLMLIASVTFKKTFAKSSKKATKTTI